MTGEDDATERDDTAASAGDAKNGGSHAVRRVDAFAQRNDWIAFPYAVAKKFGDDKAGYLAALVAYYGFFSIFPLMLVFVTVLGYVLDDNPELQEKLIDSAFGQLPLVDPDSIQALEGNPFALIVGTLTALWAGLGAMKAMVYAMNTVWGVAPKDRPNFVLARLRALGMLGVFGLGIVGVTVLGALPIITADFPLVARLSSPVAGSALAVGLFLLSFKVLTHCDVPWRAHLPGAVLGGALFVLLQLVSGVYIDRVIKGAQNTYGVFAIVIGLLSWMYVQAQIAVFSAEVNVVRHRRLWPRRLPGGEPTEIDRRYDT
jgi:membrane protein